MYFNLVLCDGNRACKLPWVPQGVLKSKNYGQIQITNNKEVVLSLQIGKIEHYWGKKFIWLNISKCTPFLSQSFNVLQLYFNCTLWSISPTFYECICANILAPKKFQPKMQVQKSLAQNFRTKKARIKRWWNWHQNEETSYN